MKILYGIQGHYRDVTLISLKAFKYECLCLNNGRYIRIPPQARKRDKIFGDPLVGTLKHIWMNGQVQKDGLLYINVDYHEKLSAAKYVRKQLANTVEAKSKLEIIHKSLALNFGSFQENLDLQLACLTHIRPDARVLLVHRNIPDVLGSCGQIALVIASILTDDSNFIVYEESTENINHITINRDFNEFQFNILRLDMPKQGVPDTLSGSTGVPNYDTIVIASCITAPKGYQLKASANNYQIWTR